jgi:hypothetical protein
MYNKNVIKRTQCSGNWMFPSLGEGGDTYSVGALRKS